MFLCLFGRSCWLFISRAKLKKHDNESCLALFLQYSDQSKAFKLIYHETRKVIMSRNVGSKNGKVASYPVNKNRKLALMQTSLRRCLRKWMLMLKKGWVCGNSVQFWIFLNVKMKLHGILHFILFGNGRPHHSNRLQHSFWKSRTFAKRDAVSIKCSSTFIFNQSITDGTSIWDRSIMDVAFIKKGRLHTSVTVYSACRIHDIEIRV